MNVDMASTNNDNNVRQLANIADTYGLRQLISEPTRITDKSATAIDLIFTLDKSDDSDIKVPFRFISLIDECTTLREVRSLMVCHVLRGSSLFSINLLL